jgi:hypothetical protein
MTPAKDGDAKSPHVLEGHLGDKRLNPGSGNMTWVVEKVGVCRGQRRVRGHGEVIGRGGFHTLELIGRGPKEHVEERKTLEDVGRSV